MFLIFWWLQESGKKNKLKRLFKDDELQVDNLCFPQTITCSKSTIEALETGTNHL